MWWALVGLLWVEVAIRVHACDVLGSGQAGTLFLMVFPTSALTAGATLMNERLLLPMSMSKPVN